MQLACTTNNIFLKILVLNCLTYSKKKKLFPGSTKSPVSSWWQESSSIYSVGTSIQIFRASKYQSPERWVGRPARAAALARRAAPLPESTRARPPLESGQRPVGAGRWLPRLLSAAWWWWWGRQKGRAVPRKRGGQENLCLSAVASLARRSPPPRLRIGGVASRFDRPVPTCVSGQI